MVFVIASTVTNLNIDGVDLRYDIMTAEDETMYNKPRIVVPCDWNKLWSALGAVDPAVSGPEWSPVSTSTLSTLLQTTVRKTAIHESGGPGYTTLFSRSPNLPSVMAHEILHHYYKGLPESNFDLGKVRTIFEKRDSGPVDEAGEIESGPKFFTDAQCVEIIADLIELNYLVHDATNGTYQFASVMEGDTIGILVKYQDKLLHGDNSKTESIAGEFVLCVEHRTSVGVDVNDVYPCEFQRRMGNDTVSMQYEPTTNESEDKKDEYKLRDAALDAELADLDAWLSGDSAAQGTYDTLASVATARTTYESALQSTSADSGDSYDSINAVKNSFYHHVDALTAINAAHEAMMITVRGAVATELSTNQTALWNAAMAVDTSAYVAVMTAGDQSFKDVIKYLHTIVS